MQSLPAPAVSNGTVYTRIRNRRRRTEVRDALDLARAGVLAAYATYHDTAAEDLANLPPLTLDSVTRDALFSNYATFRSDELYDELRLSSRTCPLCAERDPTTLDHALARTRWPEFAILAENLVPVCAECNRIKSDKDCDVDGQPIFLHAYRDRFGAAQFLDAAVWVERGTPLARFFLTDDGQLSAPLYARVRRHFDELKLAELYSLKAVDELVERTVLVAQMRADGLAADDIRDTLAREAVSRANAHGANHWRAVLYRRVAECEEFISG